MEHGGERLAYEEVRVSHGREIWMAGDGMSQNVHGVFVCRCWGSCGRRSEVFVLSPPGEFLDERWDDRR